MDLFDLEHICSLSGASCSKGTPFKRIGTRATYIAPWYTANKTSLFEKETTILFNILHGFF